MKPIDLKLPASAVVKGALYNSLEPPFLIEEILEIDLPTGITISVGWQPEFDASGAFHIAVFRGYWTNLLEEYQTKDLFSLVDLICQLARVFSGGFIRQAETRFQSLELTATV